MCVCVWGACAPQHRKSSSLPTFQKDISFLALLKIGFARIRFLEKNRKLWQLDTSPRQFSSSSSLSLMSSRPLALVIVSLIFYWLTDHSLILPDLLHVEPLVLPTTTHPDLFSKKRSAPHDIGELHVAFSPHQPLLETTPFHASSEFLYISSVLSWDILPSHTLWSL